MADNDIFAQVIIPRPLEGAFTYRVPGPLASGVTVGSRVIVPFGNRRFLTGIVEGLSPKRPTDVAALKDVEDVPDTMPMVIHPQLKFWRWIADYYMCPVGDVMKAALPSGMKVESETVVCIADDASEDALAALSPSDMALIEAVSKRNRISVKDLAKALGRNDISRDITRLVDSGVISVSESLVNRYKRVKVKMLRLTIPRGDNAALAGAFESVRRSKGQEIALTNLIALSGFNLTTQPMKDVARDTLLESSELISQSHIAALQQKGLVDISVREISRFSSPDDGAAASQAMLPTLSEAQSKALTEVHRSFLDHNVTLLHGVTSSGKTEIYIHLIDFTLRQNRQVLMLVPEIALTTQLTRRLQRVFGRKVVIYHSKFTDNERIDIWRDLLTDSEPRIVIGARSAVFLPFKSLGLVIVDEEHDPSYKQADPAPRYNGRDAAIVLASLHGAKTLLGSATPSIETYYKATEAGKYGLVSLSERFGDAALPDIEVVDMKKQHLKRAVDGVLAFDTIAASRARLGKGEQLIFFHNRRGFSPRARCRLCQFTPKCDHCDVSLTYHRRTNTLECHYCGATYPVPKICPACHEPAIEIEGYGTERIEDGLANIFDGHRILRMDLDTTRNKESYSSIIDDFSEGKADILVGTQMVTKGLDFKNVGLVGIINADSLLNFPDFRANERAFNMMEQVAGRAGRSRDTRGMVVIQTYSPQNEVIGFVCAHDYGSFYRWELEQRRQFLYPPFVRVINIYVKHRDRAAADNFARAYAGRLKALLGNRVNGPIEPPVERVASQYIRKIMLKIETSASIFKVKDVLRGVFIEFNESPVKSGATVYYDVDPV